jgi:hypothetical protein
MSWDEDSSVQLQTRQDPNILYRLDRHHLNQARIRSQRRKGLEIKIADVR